jgi:hypothetical protein
VSSKILANYGNGWIAARNISEGLIVEVFGQTLLPFVRKSRRSFVLSILLILSNFFSLTLCPTLSALCFELDLHFQPAFESQPARDGHYTEHPQPVHLIPKHIHLRPRVFDFH